MKTKWQRLIFGLVILVAAGLTIGQLSFTAAQDSLTADAGPDQTVYGPNPVMVQFHGSSNIDDISCHWFNQWDALRASGDCNPTIAVNFGKKAKPGTTRSFLLDVSPIEGTGGSVYDWVTITLGGGQAAPQPTPTPVPPTPTPEPPEQSDPLDSAGFSSLTTHDYHEVGASEAQYIDIGFLDGDRFYIRSNSTRTTPATVECYEALGQHWSADEGGGSTEGSTVEGCIGDRDYFDSGIIGVTPNFNGNVITSWSVWSGEEILARITPPTGQSYSYNGAYTMLGRD